MLWLWYLLIGLVAGWLATLIVRGSGAGLQLNFIIGIIGGILGGWLVGLVGWIPTTTFGALVASVIGAIVLLCIASLFANRKTERN